MDENREGRVKKTKEFILDVFPPLFVQLSEEVMSWEGGLLLEKHLYAPLTSPGGCGSEEAAGELGIAQVGEGEAS